MSQNHQQLLDQLLEACEARLADLARALGDSLELPDDLRLSFSGPVDIEQVPVSYHQPGLVLALPAGNESALLLIPDAGNALPGWCRSAAPEMHEKLDSLTTGLSQLLFPDSESRGEKGARYVEDLGSAVRAFSIAAEAARVELNSPESTNSGPLSVIWPVTGVAEALGRLSNSTPKAAPAVPVSAKPNPATAPPSDGRTPMQYEDIEEGIAHLPCYSRSLLKIKVPVMVTLAESRQPVENVLNIGPGSIIHFNKPCEDTLTLEVAGQKIAVGEAVKVGDKFGLWITSMILPEERFWVLNSRSVAERAK